MKCEGRKGNAGFDYSFCVKIMLHWESNFLKIYKNKYLIKKSFRAIKFILLKSIPN